MSNFFLVIFSLFFLSVSQSNLFYCSLFFLILFSPSLISLSLLPLLTLLSFLTLFWVYLALQFSLSVNRCHSLILSLFSHRSFSHRSYHLIIPIRMHMLFSPENIVLNTRGDLQELPLLEYICIYTYKNMLLERFTIICRFLTIFFVLQVTGRNAKE